MDTTPTDPFIQAVAHTEFAGGLANTIDTADNWWFEDLPPAICAAWPTLTPRERALIILTRDHVRESTRDQCYWEFMPM